MSGKQKAWFYCPVCGYRLCKVAPGAHGVYIKCKKCYNEIKVEYKEPKPEPEPEPISTC